MLDSEKLQTLTPKLFLFFAILGFSALWYSAFVVSLCSGIIALLILPYLKELWQQNKALVSVMGVFLFFGILDVIRNNSNGKLLFDFDNAGSKMSIDKENCNFHIYTDVFPQGVFREGSCQ